MGCCGGTNKIVKVGQVAPVLPVFQTDEVGLVYQLAGVELPVIGPVTNTRYKVTQGKPTAVKASDAQVMLQWYDPLRRMDHYKVYVEPQPEPQAAPKPEPEAVPAQTPAPKRRSRTKKSQKENQE